MNIYEIAKKAGVSTATVSRVINHSPKVSEKTRLKIRKLMEQENYIPSAFARGLSGTSAKSIGILTIDIRDQYFASVIHSLEQELSLYKYNVILCNTGGEANIQRNYISLLIQKKIDVLILVGSVFRNEDLKEIIENVSTRIPVIIVNENVTGDNIYSLICNESRGVSDLVEYLYGVGHRNFVYIKSSDSYSAIRKLNGYKQTTVEQNFIEGSKSIDDSSRIVDEILAIKPLPTAIICDEDVVALGIIQQLTVRGYKIPLDFSITGFNNLIYSKCSTPPLTTVDSMCSLMGITAARLALDIVSGVDVPSVTTVTSELIVRDSTSTLL